MTLIDETPFTGIRWTGHWIAPEPLRVGAQGPSFGGDVPPAPFSRTYYRRTFSLDAVPASAPARLTADARYVLWVNGVEVGRGPIRSQPRRMRYDAYDLAPYLHEGENAIAVLVTYYGQATSWWQPAQANGGLGTDALLVFEAELGGAIGTLASDDAWRVQRSTAHAVAQVGHALEGVPVEIVDARALPVGWTSTGFDDSAWPTATIAHTSHIGGFAVSQPPTDPFGRLLSRGVGELTSDIRVPAAIVDLATVPVPAVGTHPADVVKDALVAHPEFAPGSLPASADLDDTTALLVGVDFGRITAGYVELDVEGPAGTTVDMYYREYPWTPASVDEGFSATHGGARYVLGDGTDGGFRAIELHGLRYLHLLVRGPGAVSVTGVRVRESHYPWQGGASFTSDDPEIDALYAAGIRTVQMNSFDAFTDCPTREQRAWVGDGVVHQLVHLTTNADWRLARNYITLGDSPRPDGMLPMSVVGEIEAGGSVTIPDWALHWVHGVHNLYRYTGDREAVARVLPAVEGVLRWYEDYVDEHGTISDVPEWNLVDWASVFSTHRSSILTALWARGLREFAEMHEWLGNAGSAAWARQRWDAAAAGFEDFWDEARGTYVDHIVDGSRQAAASQAAGATAIVAGLVPDARVDRIVDTITDDATLIVRSWIGGEDGGYDEQKMVEQSQGVQRIDWDADTQVVIAEPFYSYVVHDAVAAAGRGGDLVRLMRRWSQFLTDGYDTFGECWGWGTPVHGWSSTPTRDLVQHVVGVTPADPGFDRVRVAPSLGALTRVDAVVPTPHGEVRVAIADGTATISSPVPVVFVAAGGGTTELPAGTSTAAL